MIEENNSKAVIQEIDSLLEKSYLLRKSNLQESIKLANRALNLSKKISSDIHIAKASNELALYYMIVGNNDDSVLELTQQALKIFGLVNDSTGIATSKFIIASQMFKVNQINDSLKYFNESLVLFEKDNNLIKIAQVNKSLGAVYENFGDVKSAEKFYKNCIKIAKKIDQPDLLSNAYNALSKLCSEGKKGKKALEYANLAYDIKIKTGDKRGLAFSIYCKAKAKITLGKINGVEQELLESLEILKDKSDIYGEVIVLSELGGFYTRQKKVNKAKKYLRLGKELAEDHKLAYLLNIIYYQQYQLAKINNDFEEKLRYLERYIAQKEMSLMQQTQNIIKSYELTAEMDKIQNETRIQKEKLEIEEQKNIELDSLIYRISHDLKGPINSMISLGYIAKMDIKDEKALSFFDDYDKQANRLNDIINDLMNLVKVSFKSDISKKIDFKKIVDDCILSFKYHEHFDKINFKVQVEDGIDYQTDWSLINTIIQNLVENGIKYARFEDNSPSIEIKINQHLNKSIEIITIDNGIGMSEEQQGKIFDMFFRVNRKISGSGIGLFILQRAVDKIGGQINVSSKLGVGSIFTITLQANPNTAKF